MSIVFYELNICYVFKISIPNDWLKCKVEVKSVT